MTGNVQLTVAPVVKLLYPKYAIPTEPNKFYDNYYFQCSSLYHYD